MVEHSFDRAAFVARIRYKPGWRFRLGGPNNGLLCVSATTPDSNRPEQSRITTHSFEIPVDLQGRALIRWVFGRLLLAEQHEAGEFFAVDEFRPFMPHHQDEGSPYELVERFEGTSWD